MGGAVELFGSAWKCAVRDGWVGWDFHHQYDYDRLKLIANNSRFVILPDWHCPNLGSKILSLCHRRLSSDWQERFGHRLLLLETFVDPRFHGTVYRAANWLYLGLTEAIPAPAKATATRLTRPKKSSSNLCNPMPRVLSQPCLLFPIVKEYPRLC